jgi:hypothetical protein
MMNDAAVPLKVCLQKTMIMEIFATQHLIGITQRAI